MRYKLLIAVPLMAITFSAQAAKGGIGAVFGALLGSAVGNAIGKSAGHGMTVEEALAKTIAQVNKQLPMYVDRETRADSIQAGPGRAFTYHYTLVNARAADVDTAGFYQEMSSFLRNSACSSKDMQVFFKNGITVSYSYRGSDGRHISKVVLTPRDCGIT